MSVTFGGQEVVKIKVGLGKSKFDSKQPIYVMSIDDLEYYGKPLLSLKTDVTYVFEIDAKGCPFYITSDSKGGGFNENENYSMRGAIEIPSENAYESGNVGIEKGTLTWTPSFIHRDMKLYYQCNFFPEMGNVIKIKDH